MPDDDPPELPSVEELKQKLREAVSERLAQYAEQRSARQRFISLYPSYPFRKREEDRQVVLERVEALSSIFEEVKPLLQGIKDTVPDIFEASRLAAIYLLIAKAGDTFSAILNLEREGFHYDAMILIRSMAEALDLASFFIALPTDDKQIETWFSGEIIGNDASRKSAHKFVNPDVTKVEIPMKDVMGTIYSALSKYSHFSYAAILDSIDIFSEDFDYEHIAGFHYSRTSSLPYLKGELDALIITLKHFYFSTENHAVFEELDSIYKKYLKG